MKSKLFLSLSLLSLSLQAADGSQAGQLTLGDVNGRVDTVAGELGGLRDDVNALQARWGGAESLEAYFNSKKEELKGDQGDHGAIGPKGDAGVYGGPSGDLFLKIRIMPEKKFRRVDNDLICSVMVTYPQLVLGSQVEIESIDGTKHTLKIPRGCPVGERVMVAGKGFVNLRNKVRGNLVVITKCHVPKKISPAAKKALGEYFEEIGTDVADGGNSILGFFKKFLG